MIDQVEILAVATDLGIEPAVVEKDYVLGWLLAGIYAREVLRPSWVFKGGTCLKKCYFETYRFSEDLDFTVLDPAQLDESFLSVNFREVAGWIYEQSGIDIPGDRIRFETFRNPRGGISCEGRVYYDGPLHPTGSLPRIKLDLTADETVVLPTVLQPVTHTYSDVPEAGINAQCYAYEEVFAEKVRALGERARPRDLYDVINLMRNGQFLAAVTAVVDVLRQKCARRNIPIPSLAGLSPAKDELAADWQAMLGRQLPVLPPFESYWSALSDFFTWLDGGLVPAPEPLAMGPEEAPIGAPLGYFRVQGVSGSSFLEAIRFAGASRLCVELDYVDQEGRRSRRIIEPYSLRETAAGDIVLYAVRVDNGQVRSYRLDRMRAVRVTDMAFVPRHAVEVSIIAAPTVSFAGRTTASRASSRFSSTFTRSPGRRPSASGGPTYVYQCGICGKKFRRTKAGATLAPHKTNEGWPCMGRTGFLTDTKW